MFNWLNELFTIIDNHKSAKRELQVCDTCEALKHQLSIVNEEKRQLLDRLLAKPEPESTGNVEFKPILPHKRTEQAWRVRQQMLEREDRAAARILRDKEPATSVDDLEKELNIVETEREKNAI